MGLELMARAGYDPRNAANVWVKMEKYSSGKQNMAFLSTHPQGEDRISLLESKVPSVMPLYEEAIASNANKSAVENMTKASTPRKKSTRNSKK